MKVKIYESDLRDSFAKEAMAALIQKEYSHNQWEIARKAYELADAMIDVKRETEGDFIIEGQTLPS